jgi:radical SAM family uncharacterized protein/radical SAM-linked protein
MARLTPEELLRVEKPSRYLGREWNAVVKDPTQVQLRLVLAFPDLYDLALGNLGLQIVHHVLNGLPWLWAERAFAPAPDLDRQLEGSGRRLGSLESGRALADFDGVGFTLQSELTYTNVLRMLELGGIPLRSAERGEDHPLVFAGGPNTVNPEPMAPFVDFFVIGDGEQVALELAERLRATRGEARIRRLEALAELDGIYVPALVPMEPGPRGTLVPASRDRIGRRVVTDLDAAAYPERPILPFTGLVHDRVAVEVLRGCTRGCRFCQAGATTRPVRERSPERVADLMEEGLASTGHEEVSLLSLSTCDHSRAMALVARAASTAKPWRASVALPSIRLDGFSIQLARLVSDIRRSGLTFAPEAATPRLRAVINKPLEDEQLLALAEQACAEGWNHLKLYFMIGLPTETDEDVAAIAETCHRVLRQARGVNGRARLNLGVSTFVPKAWTPFQWAEQIDRDEIRRRQGLLRDALGRSRAIHFGRHDADESWIEGLLARGDRRTADLIECAYRLGCRFDAWSEHRRAGLWERALEESGYRASWSTRARAIDEPLPWDHIRVGLDPAWLAAEWDRAQRGEIQEDCRSAGCHGCGARDVTPEACAAMIRAHRGSQESATTEMGETEGTGEPSPGSNPEPRDRVVLRFSRRGIGAILSHHELMSLWIRSLRRARVPLAYTQGFHAHPRVAFDAALPVGEASADSYLDLVLDEEPDLGELVARITAQLPEGLRVLEASRLPLRQPSLMALNAGVVYAARVPGDMAELAQAVRALRDASRTEVVRRSKKGPKRLDVRSSIRWLDIAQVAPDEDGRALLGVWIAQPANGSRCRPGELLSALGLDPLKCSVLRVRALCGAELAPEPLGERLGLSSAGLAADPDPDASEILALLGRREG